MSAAYEHIPVLYEPVLEALALAPAGRYIDCTVGGGGHAAGILERTAPGGQLLGIDLDTVALERTRRRLAPFEDRLTLVQGNFAGLGAIARAEGFDRVEGILFDLGVSSLQLEDAARGFSFQQEGPLDMRFDSAAGPTAADLVNRLDEEELADLLWEYGEERFSRRIARRIVQDRQREPIRRTERLARLVAEAVGGRRGKIDPATRTFMALRIAVNRELEQIPRGLDQAVELLVPGGRLVVIAFHSLEDRLVKGFIRQEVGACQWPTDLPVEACPHFVADGGSRPCRTYVGGFCDLQVRLRTIGKVRRPGPEEIARNPRARSARMRVAERVA